MHKCDNLFNQCLKQAQLGVPHSRIQVELGFILQTGTCQILNFDKNPRQSQSGKKLHWGGHRTEKTFTGRGNTTHTLLTRVTRGVGTPHNIERLEGGHCTYFVDEGNTWGGELD